jgi:hypothetical protein
MYNSAFLGALLNISLAALVPIFIFQIYYFIRDIKNHEFWK